jgi:branched-chain amino acid transport system ATP-binding protein
MSGGEQQMVSIGRALMSGPPLIAFDELSLGLSPATVDEIYRRLRAHHPGGATCIIVEQDLAVRWRHARGLLSCSKAPSCWRDGPAR